MDTKANLLRELELENGKLKGLLAEAHLTSMLFKASLVQGASPASQKRGFWAYGDLTPNVRAPWLRPC